jgi:ribosome hibernation promoting factor
MDIKITGHQITVTPALRDITHKKFEHLEKFADQIMDVAVTFDVQKDRQIAGASLNIPGHKIHATAESDDMYSSIDILIKKLTSQIQTHKEKLHHHRE